LDEARQTNDRERTRKRERERERERGRGRKKNEGGGTDTVKSSAKELTTGLNAHVFELNKQVNRQNIQECLFKRMRNPAVERDFAVRLPDHRIKIRTNRSQERGRC
jgi:hypothetical protein